MDNQLDIIAVDHGWSNIKSPHTVFTTGIQELSTEPALFENVLEYRGKYYAVGGKSSYI